MKKHSIAALTLLAALLAAPTVWADSAEGFDICRANSDEFVRYVNKALSGANITAHVAGTSVPFIVAENTALVIASPAVAAASGYAVIGAGGVFVFLNAYCNTPG
ncbi:hypothetical protein [Congregibacter litoralis]|uniref:Uncharacterized protein n=1 Tax=Congregibacter litoralis KT71 TaxID=314285 RepID=V7HV10_9GAMM|nr:hypothetical protein [Congregibacter litoralis]ESZ89377.1 hypothetical protein KT71_003436 [Congregibacter litoralis KT71]